MAEQSQQNVVVQPQSADASTSVDVSVNKSTDPAAHAAVEKSQASTTEKNADITPTPTAANEEVKHDGAIQANGQVSDAKDTDVLEEGSVQSTGVEGSVGSDTENGKADTANTSKDGDGQVPRYNLKKSASFKPVSVTKNFLAKAGASSTPVKPSHERANSSAGASPAPSAQNALRPRLVAKSASGQRGSIPKSTTMTDKSGPGSGPDPNQVWNRNRVSTPQATPKHLTDEELRQQYGIQLASRPDDSDDKGAKWADIDDEEDDWAPETIEWNDGTKINLAQADSSTAAPELSQETLAKDQEKQDGASKAPANLSKPTTVGPNATVLKLGAASHQKSPSLSAKGQSDRPTLVAKPSALAPVKSPWAPLPAVDKVSPVPIKPPVQASSQARFGQKDAHSFDAMPPPPGHQAKEIAADDFSRFSRDAPNGVPRELYVPQSGKYEPVNESRRGSSRKDSTFRQPSLLQRPSQTDQQGPAEPSAAFQTNRSQQDSVSWSRRRASSTVSGESGKFGRRMSIGKNLESPNVVSRRNSQFDPFGPAVPPTRGAQRDASPAQSQGKSITSQSPTMSSAPDPSAQQDQSPMMPPSVPGVPQEDPVVVQKRLMREKREAAIKRKKEEEEREEAERRERIRLKMEKLGLTDDKMGKKETPTTASAEQPQEPQDNKDTISQESRDVKRSKEVKEVSPSAAPRSPPKPPVPNASGAPQQYGLMKVHASQPLSSSVAHPTTNEKSLLDTVTDGRSTRPLRSQSPFSHGGPKERKVESSIAQQNDARLDETNTDSRPWANMQQVQSPYSNWGASGGMTTHSSPGGNLWGPPANHRALGNGDFQNNLQRPSLRPPQPPFSQQHLTSPPPPQPIGTPRQAPQSRGIASSSSSDLLTRSLIEDSQTIPAFPPTEPDPLHLPKHLRNEHSPNLKAAGELQHSISQPPAGNIMSQVASQVQPPAGRQAWADFSVTVGRREQEAAERASQEHAARMAEQQLSGIVPSPQIPTYNETWKQVRRGDVHGQRQVINQVKSHDKQTTPGTVVDTAKATSSAVGIPPVRSRYSDFFGQDSRAPHSTLATHRPKSPSAPPPPDSVDHPAYVGLSQKPLVKLPGAKPRVEKPVVKLPPAGASPVVQHSSPILDSRVPVGPVRGPSQPIVNNPNWQDRFNGLFNRGKALSPEKKFAHATDFSASKEPLDLNPIGSRSTAVALPTDSGNGIKETRTKTVEDENALFEERDFGSTPTIRIPTMILLHPWEPASEPAVHFKRAKALALKNSDIYSIPHFSSPIDETPRGPNVTITVHLAGMAEAKTKTLYRPTPHYMGRGKNQSIKGKHRQGPKAKEINSPQGPSKPSPSITNRTSSQGTSTPKPKSKQPSSQTTWARRPSAMAQ